MENMSHFINLVEKVISSNGPNEAPDLMNPTLQEFEAACSRTRHGDMRGMLLGDGNLYLADAESNSHTDLIDSLGLDVDEHSVRVIAQAPNERWPQGVVAVEDWARSDNDPIPDPARLVSIVQNSPAIRRIMRPGAAIKAICWDYDWAESQKASGIF